MKLSLTCPFTPLPSWFSSPSLRTPSQSPILSFFPLIIFNYRWSYIILYILLFSLCKHSLSDSILIYWLYGCNSNWMYDVLTFKKSNNKPELEKQTKLEKQTWILSWYLSSHFPSTNPLLLSPQCWPLPTSPAYILVIQFSLLCFGHNYLYFIFFKFF